MRTVVVSDLHLTHVFEPTKYQFLYRLFSQSDRVVLNGDIWDSFHTNWSRFTHSAWRHLFPLLKAKQAVYLFGNHDASEVTPEPWVVSHRWNDEFEFEWKNWNIHLEHGHRYSSAFHLEHPRAAFLLQNIIPYRLFTFKDIPINRRADALQLQAAAQYSAATFLLMGHSHIPGLHESDRYANSGFIADGRASWIEVDDHAIRLKETRY